MTICFKRIDNCVKQVLVVTKERINMRSQTEKAPQFLFEGQIYPVGYISSV